MALKVSEAIVVGAFQQNCRLVHDPETEQGVLIDPGAEPEKILEAIPDGIRITHILATHAHLDHVGAVTQVKAALEDKQKGPVPFALHHGDLPILAQMPEHGRMFGIPGLVVPTVDIDLAEVDEIQVGKETIRVVHTPGHTPGGVTFLFGDKGCFGDSLFKMSVGRTDLGGNAAEYARTLRETILGLPDETIVYCGHGPDTTIGQERIANPFLNGQISIDGN